jgi:outer membrane murein-binding lipoprotein Lpp
MKSKHILVFFLACACVVLLAACGSGLEERVNQANSQVETLSAENAALSTQIAELEATQAYMAPRMKEMENAISYFATQIMKPDMAPQPVISATPFSEVSGMVVVEGGRCCAGGLAGQTITIRAAFIASSFHGDIIEMRVASGTRQLDMEEMAQIPWEPYEKYKSFQVELVNNWVGYWVQAQFRDAEGNISPIYGDDISLEGMPPLPTPTPTSSPSPTP